MIAALREALIWFNVSVLAYFLLLNTSYLVLIVLAALEARRDFRELQRGGDRDLFADPLAPSISVIVPAFNEEAVIIESVRGLLNLRYPNFEIIVVDDGSTDATFRLLEDEFHLVEVPRVVPDATPTLGALRSVHVPQGREPITVIRKVSVGRKADAVNAGINAARSSLVCVTDADSILDRNSLLHVVRPFIADPEAVVATGGCIRVANGSVVKHGDLVDPRMPGGWIARIQVVEYLRAFLMGRAGWSRLGAVLIVSGAFGLFRRDVLIEVGGYDPTCSGEDAELITRIHHHFRRARRTYRIVFVPEPVCWTEVPSKWRSLRGQRQRWSRGMAETLWSHRAVIGNPRYGRMGLLVLPYFVVFELLSPIFEVGGVAAVALGFWVGVLDVRFALLFLLVAVGYSFVLTVAALTIEVFSYRRYRRWRDLGIAVAAALLENVGFRQVHAWWRLQGLFQVIRGRFSEWIPPERAGFSGTGTASQPREEPTADEDRASLISVERD